MPKIFISYAREDLEVALKLFKKLETVYLKPWLDQIMLKPGQNWQLEIGEAIRSCDYFLALLSNNSINKRGYVQKELRKGLETLDEFPDSHIFLIPVRIDNCTPVNERLRQLHWVDMFADFEDGFGKLISSIEFQPGTDNAPDISETRWLFADYTDFDRDVCDWIEFYEDGTFCFMNARSGNWVDDEYQPYEGWRGASAITKGKWYQTGNGFYMTSNGHQGPVKGIINGGQISGKGFSASFEKRLDRRKTKHNKHFHE